MPKSKVPVPIYSAETRVLYAKLRDVGVKAYKVFFQDNELKALINITCSDLGLSLPNVRFAQTKEFYTCPIQEVTEEMYPGEDIHAMLDDLRQYPDAQMYLSCLTTIHRHRTRYAAILRLQPLPQPVQVFPRAIIEFGQHIDTAHFLANWLVWRKWVYDIDNRSAQETGLLFEPILASALGGRRYAAQKSPIRRKGDPSKGRQVDCVVEDRAYEFKMRVTTAASGQGRFKEELSFAEDVEHSATDGQTFHPILIVLDPTVSNKLTELSAKYEKHGGRVYTGDDAWEHLEAAAGERMGQFLEQYVRQPLKAVEDVHDGILQDLHLSVDGSRLTIEVGEYSLVIDRIGGEAAEILEEEEAKED